VGDREEIERLRARVAELSAARGELDAIHRSRLWKMANVYWTLRRTIAGGFRRGGRPATPQPAAADPARLSTATAAAAATAVAAAPARSDRRFRGMRHVEGRCNVCGERTSFYFTEPALFRESLTCGVCRTTSRYRSVARGLLRAIELVAGVRSPSLAELATTVSPRRPAGSTSRRPATTGTSAREQGSVRARRIRTWRS
jgi:hypothetical protein